MQAINPATGKPIEDYPELGEAEVRERLSESAKAYADWSKRSFEDRAALMKRAGDLLKSETPQLAKLITDEMGKPITQARSEVEKCAWVCEFYADKAQEFLAPRQIATDAAKSYVRYDPLGIVLAVMPWNFPLWQVFRFAAPSLMAGNVGVLKHASNVPGSALAIENIFQRAGFPTGVFQTLLIPSRLVEVVIEHPAVKAITLTGSEQAGSIVASQAGKALKKTVLELGGSDPFIVLEDADPVEAAKQAVQSRTINNGQSCVAAKRFIVVEEVADAFEKEMVARTDALVVGDPSEDATQIGPLAREDLLLDLLDQVDRSVSAGATLACGGTRIDSPGYFMKPAVVTNVKPGMAVFDEETFGPAAAVCRVKNELEAIEFANNSPYGLGASVATPNLERAEAVAAQLEAGCVFVNQFVKSDPRVPFGGIKRSGYGRELSVDGIREFVNTKTVWLENA